MTSARVRASVLVAAMTGLLVWVVPSPVEAHSHEGFQRQRAHIEDRAREQIGTRYSYGGTSPRSGFDCSGFTRWLFSEHGAKLPHSSADQFALGGRRGYKRIWKRSNLEVGDLVFHRTTSARVGHVGVYIGGGRFISSTSSGGVRIRSVYDPYYWGPRWVGATRLPATMRYEP
ncbi:MAG TPA: C40 family peptidase [Actinomycetota bacterium]|nr:C40 family peptidase [Actinomycetota bacterium]